MAICNFGSNWEYYTLNILIYQLDKSIQSRALSDQIILFLGVRSSQTAPYSHFSMKRISALPTDIGRITFTRNILKITKYDGQIDTHIENEKKLKKIKKNINRLFYFFHNLKGYLTQKDKNEENRIFRRECTRI